MRTFNDHAEKAEMYLRIAEALLIPQEDSKGNKVVSTEAIAKSKACSAAASAHAQMASFRYEIFKSVNEK